MAAFIPLDSCSALSPFGGGSEHETEHDNFLSVQAADELPHLPADIISPLAAYSSYQEQEVAHYTYRELKYRRSQIDPFGGMPPSHGCANGLPLFGNSFAPSSSAPTPPTSMSSYLDPTVVDSSCSHPPRGPQSTSFSTAPSIYSPGLELNFMAPTSTAYDFSRYYFPLTPPVEDPKAAPQSSYPFEEPSSTLLPVFPSLVPSPSETNDADPFTVHQHSVCPAATTPRRPVSPPPSTLEPLRPLPFLPLATVPLTSSLAGLFSSGASRRRSRIPTLPSPSLSSVSVPSSNRSQTVKTRTSSGGSRSQYSRDELTATCNTCEMELATLQLRRKGDNLDVEFDANFVCFECRPDLAGVEGGHDTGVDEIKIGYHSSLSALLDREEGTHVQRTRRRIGPTAQPRRTTSSRRCAKDDSLTCDVCRWSIAAGQLRPRDPEESLPFTVEVICSHCSSTYRRCSDDGGGGGRLGVGKWRCKELFEEGRRNCSFSHARMGPIQDLIYDTHSFSAITSDLARLESTCFEFYRNSVLSALAVPDVLEGEDPIAINYEQIEKMAVDSWAHFETFFKPTSDPARQRFVGLRWANPTTRKKGRKAAASPRPPGPDAGAALRSGLRLTGFAVMEVDIENGLLFTPLTMPMGSVGETYDASTTLLQHLSRHIGSELEAINLERRRNHLLPLPPIREAWTAVLFSKDTRGANHLETRRGYMALDQHSAMHGLASRKLIEARMEKFLPACLQGGWRLFVRPYRGATDDWGELVSSRRRRKSLSAATTDSASSKTFVKTENDASDADYEDMPTVGRRSKRLRS
ncbi:hypothetical protein JCM11491_006881 [Sporobolomyces phaffii]